VAARKKPPAPPAQKEIPIQPVERPIICSPYEEPDQHWHYDTVTGAARREPKRRPASYWYRTERTGSAQLAMFGQEQQDDLPLPNLLREDVRRWRDADYRGATLATRELLRHWSREDRARRLFFCQCEAVETLIYLAEMRITGRTGRLRFTPNVSDEDLARLLAGSRPGPAFGLAASADFYPSLVDRPANPELLTLRRFCTKLATGSGKTLVAAMLITWAFVNRAISPNSREYPNVVLICAPNLTVKERLAVLRPDNAENYYDAFDLVPQKWRGFVQRGAVKIENWHRFAPESAHKEGDKTYAVVDKGPETAADFARRILGESGAASPILVINDEGHHCWRPAPGVDPTAVGDDAGEFKQEVKKATVWVDGLDRLNAAGGGGPGIQLVVDLSATPFRIKGSGYPEGQPFPWIVSDFGLVDAIESGITKIPRLPVQDTTGRPDPRYFRLWEAIRDELQPGEKLPGRGGKPKPAVVWRQAEGALKQLMGQWLERFERIRAARPGTDPTPPCLIVVCDNTDIAEEFYRRISGEQIIEAVTEADVQEVLAEDDGEETAAPVRRGRKPKPRVAYGHGEAFPEFFGNTAERKYTIRIDSKLLEQAESELTGKKSGAAEELRRVVATVGKRGEPGEHVRCVVSVAMLTEGWDANTVTQILGLRAFTSQLLCEQVVGRGLRRMNYDPDPTTSRLIEEYCDVYGVPFSVIPFRGRPVNKPEPDDTPLNLVRALPERAAMEMRFPVVEGYAFALRHNLIRCDVSSMETLRIEPNREPTATFVRPQVGVQVGELSDETSPFGYESQDREAYYASVHVQTIMFQATRRVVDALTEAGTSDESGRRRRVYALQSRHALFPQVFRIVEAYVQRKVDFNGVREAELGLEKYLRLLVERVCDAIQPDDAAGEPPLLPLLNRTQEIGSTAGVEFRTKRPVVATMASHIGHVVADTDAWEQSAAFRIEQAARRGVVRFYARNEGLGFTIPYEFFGVDHAYEPDFIVSLNRPEGEADLTFVLEVKGYEDNKTAAKHEAAQRWVRAVNNWGKLGKWGFHVCRNPQLLEQELDALSRQAAL
jgi:type III restriction enzyme